MFRMDYGKIEGNTGKWWKTQTNRGWNHMETPVNTIAVWKSRGAKHLIMTMVNRWLGWINESVLSRLEWYCILLYHWFIFHSPPIQLAFFKIQFTLLFKLRKIKFISLLFKWKSGHGSVTADSPSLTVLAELMTWMCPRLLLISERSSNWGGSKGCHSFIPLSFLILWTVNKEIGVLW